MCVCVCVFTPHPNLCVRVCVCVCASVCSQMLWRADNLDIHATSKACLDQLLQLSAAGQLGVLDVVLLSSLPPLLQPQRQANLRTAVTSKLCTPPPTPTPTHAPHASVRMHTLFP